jgi:hypothetical protein
VLWAVDVVCVDVGVHVQKGQCVECVVWVVGGWPGVGAGLVFRVENCIMFGPGASGL